VDQCQFSDPDFISGTHQRKNTTTTTTVQAGKHSPYTKETTTIIL
jgi:hypothetical protein